MVRTIHKVCQYATLKRVDDLESSTLFICRLNVRANRENRLNVIWAYIIDKQVLMLVYTVVAMFTEGNSVKQIADFLALNAITIYTYLNRWNELGNAALEDYRGRTPSNCKITAEMEHDLLQVVQQHIPNDVGFLGNVWTAKLLSDYLYQNYEVKLSPQCIRDTFHKNNFSFKRAQKKPSKGVKSEQEALKK